jgi:hypothetical protein
VHFIPAGGKPLRPEVEGDERLETILSALALTYDCVILDVGDAMIPAVGRTAAIAVVVSEFGASDPRTRSAFDRVAAVCDARTLLLVVDPAPAALASDFETAVPREKVAEGAAA